MSPTVSESNRHAVDVWLIRHGESERNAGLPYRDDADMSLTQQGHQQARAISNWVAAPPAKIVTSCYRRSQQSAEPLIDKYPDVPVVQWPVHEFRILAESDHDEKFANQRASMIEQYWNAEKPYLVQGPGAESFAQFVRRVVEVYDMMLQEMQGPIAVYSHRKFIAALVWVLLTGMPKISARRMRRFRGFDLGVSIKNGAIVPVFLANGTGSIGSVYTGHLDDS
jgi:broad specificity phosphatase PhoE